jgi:hypothetical protein
MNIWQQDMDETLQGHNLITKIQCLLGSSVQLTAASTVFYALTGRNKPGGG